MENTPKLRITHPTGNLDRAIAFYRDGLGFDVLDHYEEQQGWDGAIFGHRNWPYQIEVTHKRGDEDVPRAASQYDFMIFCIPEGELWEKRLHAMFDAGFSQIPAPELYNDGTCACYEDPDGYRVMLRKGVWKK